jgi:hypothetical protein
MALAVSKRLHEPELSKRLLQQKRLSREEILQRIAASGTGWSLMSDLSQYTRQSDKNIECTCQNGHTSFISLIDIVNNARCKVCNPKKNAGRLNPAFKDIDAFTRRVIDRFGCDAFEFDQTQYNGLYGKLTFRCCACDFVFTKAPRVLLNEAYGCHKCADKNRRAKKRRTQEQFNDTVRSIYGDMFTYAPKPDQGYGNADFITRTCNTCNTMQEQCIGNQLTGNGCSTCSRKKKHTTETFVATAKRVWGDDTFDYSLVEYVNNKQHVVLRCKNGHVFPCSPSNHMSRRGCPDCASKKFVSAGEIEWLNSLSIPFECRNR